MIKICKTNTNHGRIPIGEESTGIFMEFDNGNNISIQWGRGTYSSHRDGEARPETSTAEVLICNSRVVDFPIHPLGWCDTGMVAELIHQTSTMSFEDLVRKYGEKESCDNE
tara:strand:- start:217 stop:549 length:333 start_codon:yes stop_codon:yes gene_type:complete